MGLINSDSLLKKFESGALFFQPDIRRIIKEEPECAMVEENWILVNEEIPNSFSDNVLVTILDESGDSAYSYVDVGWCLNDGNNSWIVDNELRKDVIAWMPFPEAYKRKRKEMKR